MANVFAFPSFSGSNEAESPKDIDDLIKRQQWCCFTIVYFTLEVAALQEKEVSGSVENQIGNSLDSRGCFSLTALTAKIKPNFLLHMAELVSRFRWGESTNLPLNKVSSFTYLGYSSMLIHQDFTYNLENYNCTIGQSGRCGKN